MNEMIDNVEVEEEESGYSQGWSVGDDQAAEWAIKQIKNAEAELDKWTRYYNGMIESIKKRTERKIDFMSEKLREYFGTVPHRETATQEKYSLPSGDLIMKKPKRVWNHDDVMLLKWAKENGFDDCIKVTEKVSWADVKKRLAEKDDGTIYDTETGLICNYVVAETTDPMFEVKR